MPETYTGTEGTDAANAGMDILDGTEDRRDGWLALNKARDYIAGKFAAFTAFTARVFPGVLGTTGAPTAEQVRAALELVKWASSSDADGKIPVYHAGGHIAVADPISSGQAASKGYVDSRPIPPAGVPASGGTFTGNVYFPNSSAATSGYTVAYINGDGRLSRGASSERFKEHIDPVDPADLGDIWPQLNRYQMIGGDGSWRYGYIAERLAENEDQAPFVVYGDMAGEPVIASIDFLALSMAQNAQLKQTVTALAQRITELEARL